MADAGTPWVFPEDGTTHEPGMFGGPWGAARLSNAAAKRVGVQAGLALGWFQNVEDIGCFDTGKPCLPSS